MKEPALPVGSASFQWDANDGDAEYETVEDVCEPYPDAANEEPQHIHANGQMASIPSFRLCKPKGMPMMVIISISPAMKYSKAICRPPNMTQMMFPNVFIDLI